MKNKITFYTDTRKPAPMGAKLEGFPLYYADYKGRLHPSKDYIIMAKPADNG